MTSRSSRAILVALVPLVFTVLPAHAEAILVFFPNGGSEVPAEFEGDMRRAACLATLTAGTRVMVTGFADSKGSRKSNLALSERRASSVAAMLTRYGLACASFSRIAGRGSEARTGGNGPFSRRAEIDVAGVGAPASVETMRSCMSALKARPVPGSSGGGADASCPQTP